MSDGRMAEIFFGITFRGRLGNRDFYSGYIFGFVGTLDVNLGLFRYSYKVYQYLQLSLTFSEKYLKVTTTEFMHRPQLTVDNAKSINVSCSHFALRAD